MKAAILEQVKNIIQQRMDNAWQAMQAAQQAANSEGKSSAGDKYETARAMGQLDRDMYGQQYEQARQERLLLERIDTEKSVPLITFSSLVNTSLGWYFLAISVGMLHIAKQKIMVLSPHSPLGKALLQKTVGEVVKFNDKEIKIITVL